MRREELHELAALRHGAPRAEAEAVLDAVPAMPACLHPLIVCPGRVPINHVPGTVPGTCLAGTCLAGTSVGHVRQVEAVRRGGDARVAARAPLEERGELAVLEHRPDERSHHV